MSDLVRAQITEALKQVLVPQGGTAQDLVRDVVVGPEGRIIVTLSVDPAQGQGLEPLRQAAQQAVEAIAGVNSASVILTAERQGAEKPPPPKTLGGHKVSARPLAPQVKRIIAVASGKGGVGKSTVAVNLACALAQQGFAVGLMDADIYGPSMALMTGLPSGVKPEVEDGMMLPIDAHGVKVMSMGFFVGVASPLVWRGPMAHSATQQFLRDVKWGALDYLILDLPPGTGDVQLSVAQSQALAGAVIVSTPQDIALADARKAMAMFEKVKVPLLGIIENMSVHVCSKCGHAEHIFGHAGARAEAQSRGVLFLGEIPLHAAVREAADAGRPVVVSSPDHPTAQAFAAIARQLV